MNEVFKSDDLNKFNKDCLDFISFVKQCLENEKYDFLYLIRSDNSINYGRFVQGFKKNEATIEMTSNEDLKKVYELLQTTFGSAFGSGWKHTFGQGYSLMVQIGENIMIDVDSTNSYDKNWFYEESHKELENNSPKKR